MNEDLHHTQTVVDEGNDFIASHPELNGTQLAWGGLAWGLLRALYECPNCSGTFRIPCMSTIGIEVLYCPRCHGQWVHKDDLSEIGARTRPQQGPLL